MKKLSSILTLLLIVPTLALAAPDEESQNSLVNSLLAISDTVVGVTAEGDQRLVVRDLSCRAFTTDEGESITCDYKVVDPNNFQNYRSVSITEDASDDYASDLMSAVEQITESVGTPILWTDCTWNDSAENPRPLSCRIEY